MSFDMDTGNTSSEGPWISWSARGTQDRAIPPESFYLRDDSGKTVFEGFNTGVVMDIHNMKTGWQKSDGVLGQAPEWKWNSTIQSFAPQPGDDYKKGFQIKCAVGGGETATWEQAGAAAWNAFTDLVPQLQQGPDGQLPLVRITGTKAQQFKRGSTVQPVFEVVKWVPRPDCLKEGFSAGIDTGQEQPAQQPAQSAPAPADAEF